jgi:hypothetical protein
VVDVAAGWTDSSVVVVVELVCGSSLEQAVMTISAVLATA